MGEEEPEEKRERGIYGYSVLIVRREGDQLSQPLHPHGSKPHKCGVEKGL